MKDGDPVTVVAANKYYDEGNNCKKIVEMF